MPNNNKRDYKVAEDSVVNSPVGGVATATPGLAQPTLRAVPMGLFPTMGSLQEVVDLAKAKLPVEHHNDMLALLFTYHNTLFEELKNEVRI